MSDRDAMADFLMKTSFALLSLFGALSGFLTGLGPTLRMDVPWLAMLLFWGAMSCFFLCVRESFQVARLGQGQDLETQAAKEKGVERASRWFRAGITVLVLSPIGLLLNINLSPLSVFAPQNVSITYSGIQETKVTLSPSESFSFTLTVTNLGSAFTPSIEVTSPTNAHIIATLSQTALPLKRNDIGAVNCQVLVESESEPGSYPLIVRARSGDQIIKSEYIELEVKEHSVGLAYSGTEEGKVTLSPSESFSFILTVTNLGPAFTPSIEVTSPTNAHIVATLSPTALPLKRNDIAAINCQVSVGAESEPGSYPLIVRVRSGDQIIKSEYIEVEVKKE